MNIHYLEVSNNVITIDDNDVAIAGKDQQQPHHHHGHVLFVHGLGSSADRWLDIPDALSLLGLYTIALDLPGFGLSDKPENMDYTIRQFVNVVASFVQKKIGMTEEPNKKISIIGHSLGGYIAAQFAIEHPELTDKLVLIDSSGMLDGPTPLLLQYFEAAMNPSKQAVRAVFEQLVADRVRIPEALVDGFIYRMTRMQGAKHAFRSAFDNSVYTKIGIEKLKQIGNSNIPTLIIWGRQDRLIPLQYFKVFQEAIKGSHVIIMEDAGHAPFAEKPTIVCELLHRFFLSST